MNRDMLLDHLLTWVDPAELQERLHRCAGVSLKDADVHDLAAVLFVLEDEEAERAEQFSWEFGDCSPFEFGGSSSA